MNDKAENDEVVKLVTRLTSLYVDDFENTMLVNRNEYMDSPTCETCFEKKFINFYGFVSHNKHKEKQYKSSCFITYSSSENDTKSKIVADLAWKVGNQLRHTNTFQNYESEKQFQIINLIKFGTLIDQFIKRDNDFFLFEYIMNALVEGEEYNAYYIFKMVSIIELLIKNPKHSRWKEIDFRKMVRFINEAEDKMALARLIIQIRNKIGHGDYEALHFKAEEYAEKYMGNYHFDYYEYSRINWIFLNLSCRLNELLADIIWAYLNNKSEMKKQRSL